MCRQVTIGRVDTGAEYGFSNFGLRSPIYNWNSTYG
nr:hypothetical protein CPGR_04019 [Mycolicibacterium fortuitum subsp. fortuitum DSM 46621 = ATCC 6841 = JCM 6387]CRL80660.1 hypothetical protein CPGR_03867 [Mycolicibacter nonchromogenicus]